MRSIRNCSVCVVGGAGFLGSHLVEYLVNDRNCTVLIVDNLVTGRLEFLPKCNAVKFEHADISGSESHLCELFKAFGIKFVLNYAAHPYVPMSYDRPLYVFQTNAVGAIQVINAAQEAGCDGILQVSSAELYGEAKELSDGKVLPGKISEESEVRPHSSYGAAKAAVDYYCQVAWKERKTPVIALRQFNCIGERETHPYVVPEIISQLGKQCNGEWFGGECVNRPGLVATVRLGNNSYRDFLYAGDQARIAVDLLERGQFGEVYNLGSESGIKVYDLAKLIGKLMGFAEVEVERDEARVRSWEVWHLQSCNDKLWDCLCGEILNNPAVAFERAQIIPLEEALRRTIRWWEGSGRRWPWEK